MQEAKFWKISVEEPTRKTVENLDLPVAIDLKSLNLYRQLSRLNALNGPLISL